jgi:hypothetical protein
MKAVAEIESAIEGLAPAEVTELAAWLQEYQQMIHASRFAVRHEAHGLEPGAFDVQGIGSIPVAKLERRSGVVHPAVIREVEAAVKAWLGLP